MYPAVVEIFMYFLALNVIPALIDQAIASINLDRGRVLGLLRSA